LSSSGTPRSKSLSEVVDMPGNKEGKGKKKKKGSFPTEHFRESYVYPCNEFFLMTLESGGGGGRGGEGGGKGKEV